MTTATLTPGQALIRWLEFSALTSDASGFLEFLDSSGDPLFLVSVF